LSEGSRVTDRRWAWSEIDLAALKRNVRALKGKTKPGTRFMAVVKADGYGCGAVEVSRAAIAAGADRLGLATVDEALELRSAGVKASLQLLVEPPVSAIPDLLDNEIVPAATTREFVSALSARAMAGGTRVRYHLKIDSGMNRIGVRVEDVAEFARWQAGLGGVELEGSFTHLATADVPGDWEVRRQLDRFTDALAAMRTEGVDPGIVHAANSAATIEWPDAQFDMVRCGIAIYGLHPAVSTHKRIELEPVQTVKASIFFISADSRPRTFEIIRSHAVCLATPATPPSCAAQGTSFAPEAFEATFFLTFLRRKRSSRARSSSVCRM
jgi:alanine racemase